MPETLYIPSPSISCTEQHPSLLSASDRKYVISNQWLLTEILNDRIKQFCSQTRDMTWYKYCLHMQRHYFKKAEKRVSYISNYIDLRDDLLVKQQTTNQQSGIHPKE